MTSAAEALTAKTQLGADIAAGVKVLSLNQQIVFTKYIRLVLPIDGFVFWVKADLVNQGAMFNAMPFNTVAPNDPIKVTTSAPTIAVNGSLHYATKTMQEETSTNDVNNVMFTALSEIQEFNEISSSVIYIAAFDGIRFAFSERASFYKQADTYHYRGTAILPIMESQIIDSVGSFGQRQPVVSNSLPMWLALNGYQPPYTGGFSNLVIPLFPSFLVPANLPPPYGAVHIEPGDTIGLASAPTLGRTLSHDQLASDKVRVSLYGVRNADALTFVDAVNQYSYDTDNIGMMDIPIVRDEKVPAPELNIIAMKKTIQYRVSYYQRTARNIARQLILRAIPTYNFDDNPL